MAVTLSSGMLVGINPVIQSSNGIRVAGSGIIFIIQLGCLPGLVVVLVLEYKVDLVVHPRVLGFPGSGRKPQAKRPAPCY